MPAIQPERLKQQTAALASAFQNPELFLSSLTELLGLYAERAVRTGLAGEPAALLDKYGVPTPVLRYILFDLTPRAQNDPDSALALCDRLWQEPNLECRTLAVGLLGKIPAQASHEVIKRAKHWSQQQNDRRLILEIFQDGLATVRKQQTPLLLEMAKEWMQESDQDKQKLSLMALLPLARDPDIENLPVLLELLHPVAIKIRSDHRPELLDIILVLARRSPRETAYFVQELLQVPGCLTAGWLARQVIPILPDQVAAVLQQALHSVSNQATRPIPPRR